MGRETADNARKDRAGKTEQEVKEMYLALIESYLRSEGWTQFVVRPEYTVWEKSGRYLKTYPDLRKSLESLETAVGGDVKRIVKASSREASRWFTTKGGFPGGVDLLWGEVHEHKETLVVIPLLRGKSLYGLSDQPLDDHNLRVFVAGLLQGAGITLPGGINGVAVHREKPEVATNDSVRSASARKKRRTTNPLRA